MRKLTGTWPPCLISRRPFSSFPVELFRVRHRVREFVEHVYGQRKYHRTVSYVYVRMRLAVDGCLRKLNRKIVQRVIERSVPHDNRAHGVRPHNYFRGVFRGGGLRVLKPSLKKYRKTTNFSLKTPSYLLVRSQSYISIDR